MESREYEDLRRPDRCDDRFGDCSKTATQFAELNVPIEIDPKVEVGDIEAACCGEPKIHCECKDRGDKLFIMLEQKLYIKIPVKYSICGKAGESSVKCDSKKPYPCGKDC